MDTFFTSDRKRVSQMTYSMFLSGKYFLIAILVCSFIFLEVGNAQSIDSEIVSIVNGSDVYLYQFRTMRVDYGYNIYRQDPGDSEFIQLNDEPVRGVLYPDQMRAALGNDYQRISQLLEIDNETDLYFELRGNSSTARLYALTFPNLAQAVNRLFIDDSAPLGEEVIYRIEVVNQRDEPTGTQFEHRVVLEEKEIPEPVITEITNRGNEVTVTWEYSTGAHANNVIQFELLIEDEEDENIMERINDLLLIRDQNRSEYSYTFNVDDLNRLYDFYVTAVDITGRRGPLSEPAVHMVQENIPPGRISNVRTAMVDGNVQIQWPMSTELDVAGYHVYRSFQPDENYERLTEELISFTDPLYIDENIERGNQYYYRVTAIDENGNEGERSVAASRQVADYTPPPAPTGLSAEYQHEQRLINLNWDTEPLPGDFQTFILLRRSGRLGNFTSAWARVTTDDITETQYSDNGSDGTGFIEGAYYQYAVVSADTLTNASDTSFVVLQVPNVTPPEPVRSVRAVNRQGIRVNVTWDASISSDVVEYKLFRRSDEDEFALLAELPVQSRLYRDEEIEMGHEFTYAVAAIDSSGNESDWLESESVYVRSAAPPRRVRNVRAVASNNEIRIRWEPVVSESLEGYRVYASNRSTGRFIPVTDELLNETNTSIGQNSDYIWFRVTALDISGNESRPSDPVQLIVP